MSETEGFMFDEVGRQETVAPTPFPFNLVERDLFSEVSRLIKKKDKALALVLRNGGTAADLERVTEFLSESARQYYRDARGARMRKHNKSTGQTSVDELHDLEDRWRKAVDFALTQLPAE